jgi:hypothetical protein
MSTDKKNIFQNIIHSIYEIYVLLAVFFKTALFAGAVAAILIPYLGIKFVYLPEVYYNYLHDNTYFLLDCILIFVVFLLISSNCKKHRKIKRICDTCKAIDEFQRIYGQEISTFLLECNNIDPINPDELSQKLESFLVNFTLKTGDRPRLFSNFDQPAAEYKRQSSTTISAFSSSTVF